MWLAPLCRGKNESFFEVVAPPLDTPAFVTDKRNSERIIDGFLSLSLAGMEQLPVARSFPSPKKYEAKAEREVETFSPVASGEMEGVRPVLRPLSRAVPLAYVEIFPPKPSWISLSASPRASLVVVLHGMFRCKDDMRDLCMRLHADRVLAVDLRNHGDSTFTSTMFLQDMAADVLNLIQTELAGQREANGTCGPLAGDGTTKCQTYEGECACSGVYRQQGCRDGTGRLGCGSKENHNRTEIGDAPWEGSFQQPQLGQDEIGKKHELLAGLPSQALATPRTTEEQCDSPLFCASREPAAPRRDNVSASVRLAARDPILGSGRGAVDESGSQTQKRTRPCSCNCLIGHSLGGQVAMAAALRAPPGLIDSVVAIDICPVNYFEKPLPRCGTFDVRQLVELAARLPTGLVPGGKKEVLKGLRSLENATTLRPGAGESMAESLVVLLEETECQTEQRGRRQIGGEREQEARRGGGEAENGPAAAGVAEVAKEDSEELGESRIRSVKMQGEKTTRRERGEETEVGISAAEQSMKPPLRHPPSGPREEEVGERPEQSLPLKMLRWRMNLLSIRRSFESETLCWDLPSLPSAPVVSPACSSAPPQCPCSPSAPSPSLSSSVSWAAASSRHEEFEPSPVLPATPISHECHPAVPSTSTLDSQSRSVLFEGLQKKQYGKDVLPDSAAKESGTLVSKVFSASSCKCSNGSDCPVSGSETTTGRCRAPSLSPTAEGVAGAFPNSARENTEGTAGLVAEARSPSSLFPADSQAKGACRNVCQPLLIFPALAGHCSVLSATVPEKSTEPLQPLESASSDTAPRPPRLTECRLRQEHAAVTSFHVTPSPFVGPALLIRGLCSPWVNPQLHVPVFRAYFPRGKLISIDGASHAVHVDKPGETAIAINSLLAEDNTSWSC